MSDCDPRDCSTPDTLFFTIFWSLYKFVSIELVVPSNHLILCHLLLLPPIFPSIRVFSIELAFHIRWPKYWSFSISPSNEYSVWFPLGFTDLISLQSKRLSRVFSNTSLKPSVLCCSAFFSWMWSSSHILT